MKRFAIHSVPRSGSTWLGNIFNSHPKVNFNYQPLFSYSFKGYLSPYSSFKDICEFFETLSKTEDTFIKQEEGIKKGIIPDFKKSGHLTHICYKEVRYHYILRNLLEKDNSIKVIGLIRRPMAVIHSWLNAPKEFKRELGWKVEEEWEYAPSKNMNKPEEFNGFKKWKETTLLFEQLKAEFPNRFYLLTYDDLLNDTLDMVAKLFDFVDLEISNQTIQFLNDSHSLSVNDPYGVFNKKEKDDEWKETLPRFIIKQIQKDLMGTSMEKYL